MKRQGGLNIVLLLVSLVLVGVFTAVSAAAPIYVGGMIVTTIIYAALATSWNVVGGFAGQLSLAHAGFFGLGAFTSSILYVKLDISPWIGLVIAIIAGAAVAFLIGVPTFRLRGPYYALATLALGIILYSLSVQLNSITGGHAGMSLPPTPSWANMTFLQQWPYALIAGIYLLICLGVGVWIVSSRLGYQLAAVREDEEAARALGVNATKVKLIAGTISGALAAGVGTIYAQYVLFITPDSVLGTAVAIEIIVFAVVGGSGTVFGPLLGAVLLVPVGQVILREFGGALPGLHTLVYGIVVVIVVLLFPRGIAGLIGAAQRRIRGRGVRA